MVTYIATVYRTWIDTAGREVVRLDAISEEDFKARVLARSVNPHPISTEFGPISQPWNAQQ